ncbi:MAG: hypothetical protein IKB96_10565 [Prevotella sp.]|nr:hypothetical protein [Prevotella sp.]
MGYFSKRSLAKLGLLLAIIVLMLAFDVPARAWDSFLDFQDRKLVEDFNEHNNKLKSTSSPEELELLQHLKANFQPIADSEVPSTYKREGDTLFFGDDWVVRYEALYATPDGRHAEIELECNMALSFAILDCLNGSYLEADLQNTLPDLGKLTLDSDGDITFADTTSREWCYYHDMVVNGQTPWD